MYAYILFLSLFLCSRGLYCCQKFHDNSSIISLISQKHLTRGRTDLIGRKNSTNNHCAVLCACLVLSFGDSDRPIALPGPLWSVIILTNYSYVDLLTVGPKFTRPYVCCGYALLQPIDGTDGRTDEHSTVNRIYYADREKTRAKT